MTDETLRWILTGAVAIIGGGVGYFFLRLDERINEMEKSLFRLEKAFIKHKHKSSRRA